MSRFQALGHFVYERGERIGVTYDEAAVILARKLNAYQSRIELLKSENAKLRSAGNDLYDAHMGHCGQQTIKAMHKWGVATGGVL